MSSPAPLEQVQIGLFVGDLSIGEIFGEVARLLRLRDEDPRVVVKILRKGRRAGLRCSQNIKVRETTRGHGVCSLLSGRRVVLTAAT